VYANGITATCPAIWVCEFSVCIKIINFYDIEINEVLFQKGSSNNQE
jgi:hypothetical protein